MIKKYFNKALLGLFMLGLFIVPQVAFMATDTLLTDTLASSTQMITDHRAPIMVFIVGIFILMFIALLGKRALFWAGSMLGSIFRRK